MHRQRLQHQAFSVRLAELGAAKQNRVSMTSERGAARTCGARARFASVRVQHSSSGRCCEMRSSSASPMTVPPILSCRSLHAQQVQEVHEAAQNAKLGCARAWF